MKSLKGALSHIVLTFLFVFSLVLFARQALAQEENLSLEEAPTLSANNVLDDGEPNDGTVEVIYAPEVLKPYKERQSNWGIVAGFNYSEFYPDKYRSEIDNYSYDELFDSYPMDMLQGEIGVKYNTSLGSIGLGASLGYAHINKSRDLAVGVTKVYVARDLEVHKYAGTATYTLDTLFSEPYVAPYISGQVFTLEWSEEDPITKKAKSGATAMAFGLTAGLLIQVNWLDPDAALSAQTSSGLNNTFLDVFINQFNTSDGETDRNFETAMNLGAGLKLEF